MLSPMSEQANVVKDRVEVQYAERPEVGRDFLTVSCPEGWDDVKKLTKKVLEFRGRHFTFCSWNSDRNVANFSAPHGGSQETARIR